MLKGLPRLTAPSNDLLHVDLLRFIASAGIVAHHSIEFFFPVAERETFARQTIGLALFVDLFFAVSGFVISYIYQNRVASLRGFAKFMQRRVGRLVPLHWLTLSASIAFWSLLYSAGASSAHMPSYKPSCILDTALLLHSFLPCGNNMYFNGVSWSISAEMVLYILFPLVALIAARSRSLLLIGTLAILITLLMSTGAGSAKDDSWVGLWPVLRACPSFLMGCCFFNYRSLIARIPAPNFIFPFSLVVLVFMMIFGAALPATLIAVYFAVAAAIACDLKGKASQLIATLAPLGQLTYSMYMWHPLFILIFMNILGDKILHADLGIMVTLSMACYLAILAWSYFSFFAIETPARIAVDSIRLRKANEETSTANRNHL